MVLDEGNVGGNIPVCTEMLSKSPFLSLRDAENREYSDFMAFKKFEVLFLLNNGGNLLNTSYSMAYLQVIWPLFCWQIVDFALFFIPLLH